MTLKSWNFLTLPILKSLKKESFWKKKICRNRTFRSDVANLSSEILTIIGQNSHHDRSHNSSRPSRLYPRDHDFHWHYAQSQLFQHFTKKHSWQVRTFTHEKTATHFTHSKNDFTHASWTVTKSWSWYSNSYAKSIKIRIFHDLHTWFARTGNILKCWQCLYGN